MIAATDVSPNSIQQACCILLDLGLKSFLLCSAALLLDRALGRRVLARSTILHACLVGLALLPVAALALPGVRWNIGYEPEAAGLSPFVPQNDVLSQNERRQPEVRHTPLTSAEPSPSLLAARHDRRPRKAAASAGRSLSWPAVVLLAYAVVAVGFLLRLALSLAAVSRLKRSAAPLTPRAWRERLAHGQQRLGVAAPVRLVSTNQVAVPLVVGWRRPAIIVPERMAAADAQTIDAVLLHELAHVQRGDYAWNLLLRFLLAFNWPNPLIWLIGRAIGPVREQACDEVCIHWLGGAENYRVTLLELAGVLLRRPLAALGMAMAGNSRLQRRLKQIAASRGRAECQSRLCWRLATLAIVASVAGALGALEVVNRASAEPAAPDRVTLDGSKVKVDREKAAAAYANKPPHDPKSSEPSAPAKSPVKANDQEVQRPAAAESKQLAGEGETAAAPDEPIKVFVARVRREDFVVQTTQPGSLKASRTIELYNRIAGYIVARNANVGDFVKAGQVLAEIDAPELQAELEQARALADQAPAAVEQAQGSLDEASARLEAAQARVMQSQAELDKARRNKEDSVAIVKAQLAAVQAEAKQAEASVAVAKAKRRIAQLQSDAALRSLKRIAALAGFCKIIAPADGIVTRQAAEPGSFAKLGGEPLFVTTVTNRLVLEARIPERDSLQLEPGQHAQVWLDAERDGKPRDATVSRVGYAIDPKTRTLTVEVDLENVDDRLRPGMYGKVAIDLETHHDVLTAPHRMFGDRTNDGVSHCFRIVNGRAALTEFTADWSNRPADRVEIKTGLSEEDLVIIKVIPERGRALNLNDAPVEIINEEK